MAYSKLEVAALQLERSIQLLLDEKDYVSSITLAGASEEILGALLEQENKVPSLKSFVSLCKQIGDYEPSDKKIHAEFVNMANYVRNGLKHFGDGEPIEVPKLAAVEMIQRAVSNYLDLTGDHTPAIIRFMNDTDNF
jgi:hypothetical protein